jgi:hypothetical protein
VRFGNRQRKAANRRHQGGIADDEELTLTEIGEQVADTGGEIGQQRFDVALIDGVGQPKR